MKAVDLAKSALQSLRPSEITVVNCDNEKLALAVQKNIHTLLRENRAGGTITVTRKGVVLYIGEKQAQRHETRMVKLEHMVMRLMGSVNDPVLQSQAKKLLEEQ